MAPDEFKKFIENYRQNRESGNNRFIGYVKPLTVQEKKTLHIFFTEKKPATQLEEEQGYKRGTITAAMGTICLKIVYQNMEKLGI